MKRHVAILFASFVFFAAGCGGTKSGNTISTTKPPPDNPPVGSQKPANQPNLITQPMGESQGIGIAPDNP